MPAAAFPEFRLPSRHDARRGTAWRRGLPRTSEVFPDKRGHDEAWTNDWRFHQTVGNVSQCVLRNVSIDDFFGVAALGAGGQESLVSAYTTVPPRDPEVKIVR